MNKIYNNYHKHTKYSSSLVPDTHITIKEYMQRAKELGHKNYFTTEHGFGGSIFEAVKQGNKYGINVKFGIEAYIVKNNQEKDRGNYHVCIIARTDNARKKINLINSDAHEFGYYYTARWSLQDILKLDPNEVYVTTACVSGILKNDTSYNDLFIPIAKHFGNSLFLETQNHMHEIQIRHNEKVLETAKEFGLKLIHANDSHYIYPKQGKDRLSWLKGKGISYDDEDSFVLDYPSREEIVKRYKNQGILNKNQIEEALDSTLLFDDCENINIDKSIKMPNPYPKLNPQQRYKKLTDIIVSNWKIHGKKVDKDKLDEYKKAIKFEMNIIKETNDEVHTADYFLLNYDVIKKGKDYGGILTQTGRGSAVSFYSNKLLGFTGMDRVSLDVPMFPTRFISKSRLLQTKSIPDIDFNVKDPEPFVKATRDILGEDGCHWMISYGTMQISEAFRNVCRDLNVPFDKYNNIAKELAEAKDYKKTSYVTHKTWGKIIKEAEKYVNSIVSISRHPCACLIMDKNIREEIGLIRSGEDMCVVITSDESDEWKYLKNDYLTVSVVGLIDDTFKEIGLETPEVNDLIPLLDNKVWDVYANGLTATLNQVSTPNGRKHAMEYKPKNYQEMSALVAALRPGFKSLFDGFKRRIDYTNGVKELDELLIQSQKYMLYQESIMQFLVWLGIAEDETYSIVKNIAKKKYMKPEYKPELEKLQQTLKSSWIEHVGSIDGFDKAWQVVEDNAFYSFNCSHSASVGFDSLYGAYLKAHHPLEYFYVALNKYSSDIEMTTRLINEAHEFGAVTKPSQFRHSLSQYTYDKQTNTIYKGIGSIKDIGKHVGDELSKFYNKQYTSLISLLDDIYQYDNKIALETYEKSLKEANKPIKKAYADSIKEEYTKEQLKQDDIKFKLKELRSVFNGKLDLEVREKLKEFKVDNPTNALVGKAMLEILAKLSFFKEFGKSNKILQILDVYDEFRHAKQFNKNKLAEMDGRWQDIIVKYANKETESVYSELDTESIINDIIDLIEDEDISVDESLLFQKEKLGYISNGIIENPPSNYCVVDKIYKNKNQSAYLKLKTLTGKEFDAKIDKRDLNWSIEDGTILELRKITKKYRYKLVGKDELTGKNKYKEDKTQPKIMWFLDYRIVESKE